MKKWIIRKNGKTVYISTTPYPPMIEKYLINSGYEIEELKEVIDNGEYNKHQE